MERANWEASFEASRGHLWALAYRMMGTAADAEDLVQAAYLRALEKPPPRGGDARGWLVRVTMNLARDELRRRQHRAYAGPWLPAPIATPEHDPPEAETRTSETRYAMAESLTFAFLLALEALSPQARAVLLLRDVFDYSGREAANVLELSEANVKTTLHRARKAMAAYDRRRPPRADETVQPLLERFLAALMGGDLEEVVRLLAEDAEAHTDGGGAFHAARNVVLGGERVAKFFLGILRRRQRIDDMRLLRINGMVSLVIEAAEDDPLLAPRFVTAIDPTPDGERIARIYVSMAPDKLNGLQT